MWASSASSALRESFIRLFPVREEPKLYECAFAVVGENSVVNYGEHPIRYLDLTFPFVEVD